MGKKELQAYKDRDLLVFGNLKENNAINALRIDIKSIVATDADNLKEQISKDIDFAVKNGFKKAMYLPPIIVTNDAGEYVVKTFDGSVVAWYSEKGLAYLKECYTMLHSLKHCGLASAYHNVVDIPNDENQMAKALGVLGFVKSLDICVCSGIPTSSAGANGFTKEFASFFAGTVEHCISDFEFFEDRNSVKSQTPVALIVNEKASAEHKKYFGIIAFRYNFTKVIVDIALNDEIIKSIDDYEMLNMVEKDYPLMAINLVKEFLASISKDSYDKLMNCVTDIIEGKFKPYEDEFSSSKGNRLLIDYGFQIQAWMDPKTVGKDVINIDDWKEIGFTTPCFAGAPMFSERFFKEIPNSQWALAMAPYGDHIDEITPDDTNFMSDMQLAQKDTLVSLCFGDEEYFSEKLCKKLDAWFKQARNLCDNTLIHTNQWTGQWDENKLNYYVQYIKPDMLSFDNYYFFETGPDIGGNCNRVYDSTNRVRRVAMKGHDGTSRSPIPFGQYTLGYRTGKRAADVGWYVATQSQLNIVSFATIVMGGKWLNFFRWIDTDTFLLYDDDGNKKPQFNQYAEISRQIKCIAPHLVHLDTKDVRFIAGSNLDSNGGTKTNPLPKTIDLWASDDCLGIHSIEAFNVGADNDGLKGDIVIGYFNTITDYKEDFFGGEKRNYFAVLNGLATGNGKRVNEQKGSGFETRQKITLVFNDNKKTLKRVSRYSGETEIIKWTKQDNKCVAEIILDGGTADLLYLI